MADSPDTVAQRGMVAVIRRDGRFLVIRRSQTVRAPGAFCFPGGGIQDGESERQALAREMREELACAVTPHRCVWRSVTDWDVSLAWWQTGLAIEQAVWPNPEEVESVQWLTEDEMRQVPELLSSNRQFLDAWQARRFRLD